MKIAGVITEYNPFTKGHAYHLSKARGKTGADFCIAVMSGDFVQRGEPAIFSKQLRTEMALAAGADAVFELPVDSSTGSAEFFAAGAVALLEGLGCVDALVFGSERGEIAPFLSLAPLLAKEELAFQETLRRLLRSGLSFPSARAQALLSLCPEPEGGFSSGASSPLPGEIRQLLSSPNNILGLEYCKALIKLESSMRPFTIKRQGAGYHDAFLVKGSAASASALRLLLTENDVSLRAASPCKEIPQPAPENIPLSEELSSQLPPELLPIYQRSMEQGGPVTPEDFSLLLFSKILTKSRRELEEIWDLTPELAARIHRLQDGFLHWTSFVALLKNRSLTQTRIQRALLHLLLDIRGWQPPAYARLLGFRRESAALLTLIKKNGRLPLITKLADAALLLSSSAQAQLDQTVSASLLYEAVYSQKYKLPFTHEFRKPLVIL